MTGRLLAGLLHLSVDKHFWLLLNGRGKMHRIGVDQVVDVRNVLRVGLSLLVDV